MQSRLAVTVTHTHSHTHLHLFPLPFRLRMKGRTDMRGLGHELFVKRCSILHCFIWSTND